MKCKRKYDGRKLDHKTLEALRIRTVERVLDSEDPEELGSFPFGVGKVVRLLAAVGPGVCQERCPLNVHLVSRLFWSRARISLGGLSQTSAMGFQLRVGPLQRWGWRALACA